jgi:hypothetical protein
MKLFTVPTAMPLLMLLCTLNSCSIARSHTEGESANSNGSNRAENVAPEAGTGKAAVDQQIRKVDFKNFTYDAHCAGEDTTKVTVKNGEFSSEKQEDGYVDRMYFNVFEVSYGDLNGDNSEEAIVLTVCNTGGTGNFSEGFIYTLKGGKPVVFANIPGGDRAYGGLRTARVENGQLVVETNNEGENGAACCPEFVVTTRYDVSSGKLKQVGKEDRRPVFPEQRVSFPKGSSGTTMKIRIPADEGRRYIVGARQGQTLDVSISSDKASLRLLEDADVNYGTQNFRATLPKSGDYTIEVQNNDDKPLDATLNIKIN